MRTWNLRFWVLFSLLAGLYGWVLLASASKTTGIYPYPDAQLAGSTTPAVSYLLRDEFTSDLAAGSVNGTAAEPGPGARVVVDASSKLSLASGNASFATGATAGLWLDQVTRAAGRLLVGEFNFTSGTPEIGWGGAQSAVAENAFWPNYASGFQVLSNASYNVPVGAGLSTATSYKIWISLKASGAYFLVKGGVYTNPILVWMDSRGTDTSVFPGVRSGGATTVFTSAYLRVADATWTPTPLAYDTFTRANGAIGSTETTGPDSQSVTARAWTSQVGTVAISTNAAIASAVDTGLAIGTVTTSKSSVVMSAKLTKGTTGSGVVVCYVDASNYVYGWHDGTNAQLIKVVADTPTTVITAAAGAGAYTVVVTRDGQAYRLYWNNALIGTQQNITDSVFDSCTMQGVLYKDTDSTVDNFLVFPRGTGGEFAALDNY